MFMILLRNSSLSVIVINHHHCNTGLVSIFKLKEMFKTNKQMVFVTIIISVC
jgi:hypothetical protein